MKLTLKAVTLTLKNILELLHFTARMNYTACGKEKGKSKQSIGDVNKTTAVQFNWSLCYSQRLTYGLESTSVTIG